MLFVVPLDNLNAACHVIVRPISSQPIGEIYFVV